MFTYARIRIFSFPGNLSCYMPNKAAIVRNENCPVTFYLDILFIESPPPFPLQTKFVLGCSRRSNSLLFKNGFVLINIRKY